MGAYIQYGAGLSAPSGWRHFDASPTLRLQRLPGVGRLFRSGTVFPPNVEFGDIVRGLPIPNDSCSGVYCSHVLEHLPLDGCRLALLNTYAYLAPGGVFRLVLPDLASIVQTYLDSTSDEASHEFMRQGGLGLEQRPRGLSGLLRHYFGNSAHRWLWDFKAMSHELRRAGFGEIRRATLGDSIDPHFNRIEQPDRWESALGIECRK